MGYRNQGFLLSGHRNSKRFERKDTVSSKPVKEPEIPHLSSRNIEDERTRESARLASFIMNMKLYNDDTASNNGGKSK